MEKRFFSPCDASCSAAGRLLTLAALICSFLNRSRGKISTSLAFSICRHTEMHHRLCVTDIFVFQCHPHLDLCSFRPHTLHTVSYPQPSRIAKEEGNKRQCRQTRGLWMGHFFWRVMTDTSVPLNHIILLLHLLRWLNGCTSQRRLQEARRDVDWREEKIKKESAVRIPSFRRF